MKLSSHLEIIKGHLIAQESVSPIAIVEKMEKHIDKFMKSYIMEDPYTNMEIQVVMATIGNYAEQITTITKEEYKFDRSNKVQVQVEGDNPKYFTPEGKQLLDIIIGNLINLHETINETV